MGFIRRHGTALGSAVVLVLLASALVVFALSSDGYPSRRLDLNDGGIWVTSGNDHLFGRLNRPAGSLDAAMNPVDGQSAALDTLQQGAAVVAWDQSAGKLYPVDVTRSVIVKDHGTPVSSSQQVGLAGGTLAVLDPASGKVWAQRVDASLGVAELSAVDSSASPLVTLDPPAAPLAGGQHPALAVSQSGTVLVVSESGELISVSPTASGFGEPSVTQLGSSLASPQITAVGTDVIAFDPTTGTLILPGNKPVNIQPDPQAKLQATSSSGGGVVVATSTALLSVDLRNGNVSKLADGAAGKPAQPTWLGTCVYAAWAGDPVGRYEYSCSGAPATPGNVRELGALANPVFRVNRNSIVLNDLTSGRVIDLDDGQRVDNWQQVKPPPIPNQTDQQPNDQPSEGQQDQPPTPKDDTFGARPGRTTTLHVLDNDTDPQGYVLTVSAVTASNNPDVTPTIAPDGQTVQIAMLPGSGPISFRYTVDNGKGLTAQASVTVNPRGPTENEPPTLRLGSSSPSLSVVAGSTISVPVLGDWRDYSDGDPVVLEGAKTDLGSVTTSSDGRVTFTAGPNEGTANVSYDVSDGFGGETPVSTPMAIKVIDPSSGTGIAPIALPDVARGVVGKPITVRPLENDLPGADPSNPVATMTIAGEVPSVEGTTVKTDLKSGEVTVVAARPGTFLLTYTAAFSNAPFSAAQTIRVDAVAAAAASDPPVAMPDTSVIHGQAPDLVDVLANDFDPGGGVLVVQRAQAMNDVDLIQVAVVQGRWLRVNATTPLLSSNPAVLQYEISNGTSSAKGEVTVTQLPALAADTPVPRDDYATVRAGDVVVVPVLENDTNPGGSPITLASVVPGAPSEGQLPVIAATSAVTDKGAAYVSGVLVRYVAPAAVDSPQGVVVDYVAQDPAGNQATGHLHITINPPPATPDQDLPPSPTAVESRVVAGDTITIPIKTYGVDPDGDSVSVTGIGPAAAPAPTLSLGRVVSVGATSIVYEAFPTSGGTDAFSYKVTDPYGKVGVATIRVGVVPPGDPQAPVAVDDQVTAAPGASVQVDPLANDFVAAGDNVTISPTAGSDTFPDGVTLESPTGPLTIKAPGNDGKPLVIPYAISNGIGAPSVATVTVRAQEKFNNPPVALDAYAEPSPDATSVTVDVLSKAYDPEGTSLKVTHLSEAGASVNGGSVVLAVTPNAHSVAYEVTDADGATAAAVIHVPAVGGGAPYVKAGSSITIDKDGTKTVNLADYVVDPTGKPVRLTTTDQISAAPGSGLQVANSGDGQLVLTGINGYVGPGAVSFEVTDGAALDSADAQTAFLSIPVQVGPETPVLFCPKNPITVVEGGVTVSIDVARVCHVWVPDKSKLTGLNFDANWVQEAAGVSIDGSGSHTIQITASGSAKPGDHGTIHVSATGTESTGSDLVVQVAEAPRPSIRPVTIDGFKAGNTATIDLSGYVSSQLRDPKISVVNIQQTAGMAASSSPSGSSVSITPGAGSNGTMTFEVTVSDVADASRLDRQATGTITMNVLNVPDKPTNVTPDRTVLSHVVQLSWSTPANNGAPIDHYTVEYAGGSTQCAASPCTISGLTNGTEYTFTVKAHNLVGDSDPSAPSAAARPNAVPDAVTQLTASAPQDHQLTLTWSPAHVDGTAVTTYRISWTGGGTASVDGSATTFNPGGLVNDNKYTFTVIPVNDLGPGAPATVQGQSAGKPASPAAPTITATNDASTNSRVAVINWAVVDPNGIAPTSYTVNRSSSGGARTLCVNQTATTCRDSGISLDGTIYSYSIVAMNAAAASDPASHTSSPGPVTTMEATTTPDAISNIVTKVVSATPDGQVPVTFTVGASHGASSTVSCTYAGGSCGSGTFPVAGQAGATLNLAFPAGWSGSFTLKDCNGSSQSDSFAGSTCNGGTSASVATNGPPNSPPGGGCAGNGTNNPTFQWSPPGTIGARTIQGYNYSGAANGSTGATSLGISVPTDGGVSTLFVQTVDSAGEVSAGSLRIDCQHPSPPPATITASQGAFGYSGIGTCPQGNTTCHWLNFTLSSNFPSGTYTWECISNGVVSFTSSNALRFNAGQSYGGSGNNGYCIFGAGVTEQIRIANITSNPVPHQ